jgi:hypothetical protein
MTGDVNHDEADEQPIVEFMARVSALQVCVTLPDSTYVWWKAQLLRRHDARRRATSPIDAMQPIQIAAGVVAAVWLFYSSVWPLLRLYAL